MRPTLGLVSRRGVIPLQSDRDTAGPMTRTVEDNARLLSILAGYDEGDPITAEMAYKPPTDYTKFLQADGLRNARIGVLRTLAPPEGMDPQVLAAFNRAIADLQAAGATITDPVDIPNLEVHLNDGYFCARFAFDVNRYLKVEQSPSRVKDVADVFRAGTYSPASKLDFQRFLRNSARDPGEACPYYLAHPGRRAFLHDIENTMDRLKLDALVYPTWRFRPPRLENSTAEYRGDNSQLLAPPTGMPAITVPDGFPDNLPAGLQFLGRRFDEGILYKLAYAYEQKTHWRRPPLLDQSGRVR
jgi:Asp-tRNA(Asn)/Glu-tRNA(Gln) amidotransferase A subunit family amidase